MHSPLPPTSLDRPPRWLDINSDKGRLYLDVAYQAVVTPANPGSRWRVVICHLKVLRLVALGIHNVAIRPVIALGLFLLRFICSGDRSSLRLPRPILRSTYTFDCVKTTCHRAVTLLIGRSPSNTDLLYLYKLSRVSQRIKDTKLSHCVIKICIVVACFEAYICFRTSNHNDFSHISITHRA